jgi:aryl-alcohol dehydrogenase-like predicted oxidoreductase
MHTLDLGTSGIAVSEICLGTLPNQVIYAWMIQGDPAVIPLTSPSSLPQLQENLGALSVHLSLEQLRRLDTAGRC